MIVGNFTIPLSPTERSSRQKLNRNAGGNMLNQMEVADIYRTLHRKTKVYSYQLMEFSPRHKASLNRYKKTEIHPASYLTTTNYSCIINNKNTYAQKSNKSLLNENENTTHPNL